MLQRLKPDEQPPKLLSGPKLLLESRGQPMTLGIGQKR